MDLRRTIVVASETLTEGGIAHALIGGLALAVHGINRATADVDFLVDGAKRDAAVQRLELVGFTAYHQTAEVLQFRGVGALDVLLANRPLTRRMLDEARGTPALPVRTLRAEDIIGLKIQAYCNDPSRELRDKADIQALLRAHPGLDESLIKSYADLFDQWAVIEKLRERP